RRSLRHRCDARAGLAACRGRAGTDGHRQCAPGPGTCSRYWEQADAELQGTGIDTMRAGQAGVPTPSAWVVEHLPQGACVAIDGQVLSVQAWRQWQDACRLAGLRLATDYDLPGLVWEDRPDLPVGTVSAHEPPWACRSRSEN